ncbi:helix-turn-helix domain-containing protein [Amycolatopsis sp. 195334CR]|uniref:helix-turn-helix domain-containing protein n=1 Tax=Amycolatopsis sp. 195334CR TaxID=2814588 RepID=UPI001A8CF133|nr:helix-turn-helix domain-containing protein [Amycolatopsis sp. 195334CR]MBN6034170.1 helix-turn-helix domain-containing protein [Amycolatopsis sp. 195334CR]
MKGRDFAAAVERHRRDRGLTVGDVAVRTNLSRSYLSKLLHGHRKLSPDLVRLIDAAVQADGELLQFVDGPGTADSCPRPMQLPPAPTLWVGRTAEFHALDTALVQHDPAGDSATIVVIEGGPWVGKTALALRWAARVQARFPGGCLFANLEGCSDGSSSSTVLDGFLRALGATPEVLAGSLAERAAWYRSMLAQQPTLVILDGVTDYGQVRDLLPGPGSVAVVTSRVHQAALLLHTGGLLADLNPLGRDDALMLLRRRLGDARVAVDPRAADTVVDRCAGLPAALLLAAEFLEQQHLTMAALADELGGQAMSVLVSPDPTLNVQRAVGGAYQGLTPVAQRVFRLLAVSPALHADVRATAALAGLDLVETQSALTALRQTHLIEEAEADRLRLNAVIRAYGRHRSAVEDSPGDVEVAHGRLLRWYAETARAASNALAPGWTSTPRSPTAGVAIDFDYDRALAWCGAEVPTVVHIIRQYGNADEAVFDLIAALSPYFYLAGARESWLIVASEGLAAARDAGSRRGIAACSHSFGWVLHELGRTEDALRHLSTAAEHQSALSDYRGLAWTTLRQAACYETDGRFADARRAFQRADELFVEHQFELGVIVVRSLLSVVLQQLGVSEVAGATAEDALARAQRFGSSSVTAFVQHRRGLVLQFQQRHRAALGAFDAALALRGNENERLAQAETLAARADSLAALREDTAAVESYEQAARILAGLGDPRAAEARVHATTLAARLRPVQ